MVLQRVQTLHCSCAPPCSSSLLSIRNAQSGGKKCNRENSSGKEPILNSMPHACASVKGVFVQKAMRRCDTRFAPPRSHLCRNFLRLRLEAATTQCVVCAAEARISVAVARYSVDRD